MVNVTQAFFFKIELFLSFFLNQEAKNWQWGLQDAATPIAEGINDIHNHVNFFLLVVFIFVSFALTRVIYHFGIEPNQTRNLKDWNFKNFVGIFNLSRLKFTHNTTIEIIWTIIPSMILYLIAVPSFLLLYSMDEIIDPGMTVKIIGHQWYWSYEYSDFRQNLDNFSFDSYMLPLEELQEGELRLLEVDNEILLPINTHVRAIITATDVLHCWAVPALGIKIDAVPGRLNQGSIFLKRLGVFFGQCSEICGASHGAMPIAVKSVQLGSFSNWILNIAGDL